MRILCYHIMWCNSLSFGRLSAKIMMNYEYYFFLYSMQQFIDSENVCQKMKPGILFELIKGENVIFREYVNFRTGNQIQFQKIEMRFFPNIIIFDKELQNARYIQISRWKYINVKHIDKLYVLTLAQNDQNIQFGFQIISELRLFKKFFKCFAINQQFMQKYMIRE